MTVAGIDTDLVREQVRKDGYTTLPGFLNAEEIERLRSTVGEFFASGRGAVFNLGLTQPNAAIEVPGLAWLFSDPRVVSLFKGVYGEEGTFFTGHCDIHDSIVSNWHRDTGGPGHPYFDGACFDPDCRVYKLAFYLQDQLDGGGLTVIPGSHLSEDYPERDPVELRSKAGDAVLFDVRIQHRGRSPNAFETTIQRGGRFLSRMAQKAGLRKGSDGQPRWTAQLRTAIDRVTGTQPRLSVFFTFGPQNRFTRQFAQSNMARQLEQYRDGHLGYPEELVTRLSAQGVTVFDPAEATGELR